MWQRSILKHYAKNNLRTSYWPAFGVTAILIVLVACSQILTDRLDGNDLLSGRFSLDNGLADIGTIFSMTLFLLGIAYDALFLPVLYVGCCRWFSRNRESARIPMVRQLFNHFNSDRYLKTAGAMLWMILFTALWSLLILVPFAVACILSSSKIIEMFRWYGGIDVAGFRFDLSRLLAPYYGLIGLLSTLFAIPAVIKSISYSMTPWILADNLAIGCRRALQLSKELTRGQIWAIFVLDLSFAGWLVLAAIPCLLGIPFVCPYIQAVYAELYAMLRQNGAGRGLCTLEELGFEKAGAAPDAVLT
jgi:uncharacterized membrane protein